jgi:hypothetical protein
VLPLEDAASAEDSPEWIRHRRRLADVLAGASLSFVPRWALCPLTIRTSSDSDAIIFVDVNNQFL